MLEPADLNTCQNCGEVTYIDIKKLCQQCYTSGNKNIDNFIKHTQISGLRLSLKEYRLKPKLQPYLYLEWVPFNNFSDIEYIAAGGFSKFFKATLNLNGQKRHIVLKVLNYSKNVDTKFLNEISGLRLSLKEYRLKPKLQPYLYLEWVPFNNFSDIEYIAAGGFSKIFKATLNLNGQKRHIVLKVLNYSKNVDTKFLNELKLIYQLRSKFVIKCYGATKDPKTKNYAFILDYAPSGDLNHFLHKNFKKVTWKKKIDLFRDIIIGIKLLHDNKIIHCDLHSGNILIITNDFKAVLSDLGFSQRVTVNSENSKKKPQIFGIIPYMAPELFKGKPYTFASDIYSLGMILWELTTGHKPFYDQEHGTNLIYDILDGKRPEITKDTPECWENLMKKCWHHDPSQRPTIDEIYQLFIDFKYYCDHSKDDIKKHYPDKYDVLLEFKKAEKVRLEMIKSKKQFVDNPRFEHPGTRYFSRLLDLESISIINSSISDQFDINNIENSELDLSDQFSIDNFDIMNSSSDRINNIENSDLESSEENSKNSIFTFFCILLLYILLHVLLVL
ncbi:hypothetical protein Glove_368g22 [Diversispora epigaea]|uniref:Protein kinase domain-containing protein n=1 Tax=Diversispora epigaea TaxID=1348612 RepID=A0A397H6Q0_9GLOM|nr:hypothetical protein Glove_368g22 [Diversispora epigaea]